MEQSQDYRLVLSARISALEKVVEQLAVQQLSGMDNAAQLVAEMRRAAIASLEIAPQTWQAKPISPVDAKTSSSSWMLTFSRSRQLRP